MANLVYCNNNNLLKNNYYFALSTTPACNPTKLHSSHTGITDSGASGFYFAPGAPVSYFNLQASAVGVRVANNLPEQSVASATLASAPSLPPALMQGHVMPSFPHTLIGFGPFANLGCQIVFTKTAMSTIHPDGHTILEGWREDDGPRLWHFPLQATQSSLPATALFAKYEELGPIGSAAIFIPAPPVIPIQCPPASPMPPPCRPPPTASTAPLHPSQGFSTVDNDGQACFVSYQYGASQALALASRSSTTPFDPYSLDLPSVGALVGFYRACLGFPVKQTWLDTIKAENCDSFNGLTYANAARYFPDADETIMGHLTQQPQNVWSTKPKPLAPNPQPSPAHSCYCPPTINTPIQLGLHPCLPHQ
jgi:hypothetical protein